MERVESIFWRIVTPADFFAIERSQAAAPVGGGGQTYIDIPVGGNLSIPELAEFLGVARSEFEADRPTVRINVGVVTDPDTRGWLTFGPLSVRRYRIMNQNRQFRGSERHPAWTSRHGFPTAPDDIASRDEPRMPDLGRLKILIVKTAERNFYAGHVNDTELPDGWPEGIGLEVLVAENRELQRRQIVDGVLAFENDGEPTLFLDPGNNRRPFVSALPVEAAGSAEVEEVLAAVEITARARTRRRGGQGIRISPEERKAIEDHAMSLAKAHFERDWEVEDVSAFESYDLRCVGESEEIHVEVKGSKSSADSVLLTRGEVRHAREPEPRKVLFIVGEVVVEDEGGLPIRTRGGVARLYDPWLIDDGELLPTGYEHVPPPGGGTALDLQDVLQDED